MSVPSSLSRKRLEKFLKKCRAKCGSSRTFQANFRMASGHLNKGIAKDPRRFSFTRELIAAVILEGKISFETSTDGPPIEIAVDGKLLNYEWVNLAAKGFPVIFGPVLHVRVVVREAPGQCIIITVYAWNCDREFPLPEIERNVW